MNKAAMYHTGGTPAPTPVFVVNRWPKDKQPPGMMHTATPVGKDCVMGLASYSAAMKIFKWMVGTLRFSGYDGHIILGVHPQISQAEREYLIKHQVCEKHKACVYGVYVYDVYGVYVYDVYGESIAHHCALGTRTPLRIAHHCALHTLLIFFAAGHVLCNGYYCMRFALRHSPSGQCSEGQVLEIPPAHETRVGKVCDDAIDMMDGYIYMLWYAMML
jgi:hypothetical protein